MDVALSIEATMLTNESEPVYVRDNDVVSVPIPALLLVLSKKEEEKGSPLTRREVETLRSQARCMLLPRRVALALQAQRGYRDIDLHHCWEDWSARRACFASGARCHSEAMTLAHAVL